ncbi:MAG TPA: helix-turn-helix domain-containing protein [Ktedonobacteraceae bacterium]|nr:helix-turn-helix domain-containing protein [Ktedonobacteraceae bacterium]
MESASDNDISLADFRALAEFRYQLRRFTRFSEQAVRAVGLEPQQHQLLLAVKGLPEGMIATIGTLADRLQIEHHSAVELINRLADKGLVERQRDDADMRRVLVRLTASGEALLHKLSVYHRAELRSTGSALVRSLEELINEDSNSI